MGIVEKLERTTEEIISLEEFKSKLRSGKQLKIKFGADVTAPFLHLGHAVNLWMMREMQNLGHKVIFLIGDFTTRIGDPTGKSKTRKIIPLADIEKNAEEFIKQVGKVLITDDPNLFEVRRNSEWFDRMNLGDFMNLLSMVTHSKLVSRDMFKERIKNGQQITMQEMLYPILQGFDSVMLQSDLTIVGSDQLFNEMMGRFFQEKENQDPQVVITSKITAGLDGKEKQSKSLNNYIAITDSSRDKFGKVMSLPDEQIIPWFRVYTDLDLLVIDRFEEQLNSSSVNPRDIKLKLAEEIVKRYHGVDVALNEIKSFEDLFRNRSFPEDAPILHFDRDEIKIMEILSSAFPEKSNSQLKTLLFGGAVSVNGDKVISLEASFNSCEELEVKIGKRGFFRVVRG